MNPAAQERRRLTPSDQFAAEFAVKSNDSEKAQRLFTNERLKELIVRGLCGEKFRVKRGRPVLPGPPMDRMELQFQESGPTGVGTVPPASGTRRAPPA